MSSSKKDILALLLIVAFCAIAIAVSWQKETKINQLQERIRELESESNHDSDFSTDSDSNTTSPNYIDMELWGFATEELFDRSSKNGRNYYRIEGESLKYRYYGYVDETYAKGREKEWLSALKDATQTNVEVRDGLKSLLSCYDWAGLQKEGQDEELTDESLSIILDRLKVLPTGELYVFEEDVLRDLDIFLRGSICDPKDEFGWGLYLFFPAISY